MQAAANVVCTPKPNSKIQIVHTDQVLLELATRSQGDGHKNILL